SLWELATTDAQTRQSCPLALILAEGRTDSASGRPDLPGHEHLPRDGHLPRHELQQRVPADRAFITWMDTLCDFPSLNALDRYQALMDPHWTMQLRNFAPKLERHIETFRRCV
ncbi:MAG: hypothetical protein EBX65_05425, partial [Betaproteobacteria bacterium]|nr:hypothetical protein [Betaproteobacteria bacterium]